MPERLGPYAIRSRLGVGGMGEVYLAHDARLEREVAIKVLPDGVASDPERSARFKREARVAASLNHPNVAGIYGFEEEGGKHFLVMELVRGITLHDRLQAGPLLIEDALRLGVQVASGLEAAHERDIVHRDLKPSNVKVTPEGTAKVLDFGLAKEVTPPGGEAALPMATITSEHTLPGMVLGTPPYMSPEQAKGRTVDRRTDVWSFGCLLYECLTGKPAFEGETPADVFGKILERDPDWSALPPRTPARVRDLLERCLEKDPARRLRDAGDARIELERALAAREWTSSAAFRAPEGPRFRAGRLLPWGVAAAAVLVAALVGLQLWRVAGQGGAGATAGSQVPMRVDLTDPAAPPRSIPGVPTVSISPDGSSIAYVGWGSGAAGTGFDYALYVRSAEDVHARRLDVLNARTGDVEPAGEPLLSPDGQWLYYANWGVYRVPLAGGRGAVLSGATDLVKGITLVPGGIVFSPAPRAGLSLLPEGGGPAKALTVPDASKGEISHRWPDALPDGKGVLFTIKKEGITSFDEAEIALLDLGTKRWTTVLRGGSFARYLPTGHLAYAAAGRLWVVPFDLESGKVHGAPVQMVDDVMTDPGSGAAQFAVASKTGTLVFVPGGPDVPQVELVWVDRTGRIEPVGAPLGNYDLAALSPDGTRVAVTAFGASDVVYVYDVAQRALTRVTTEGNCSVQAWTADGKGILYSTDRTGKVTLERRNADGSGSAASLNMDLQLPAMSFVASLTGGTNLVYFARGSLWLARLTEGGMASPERLSGITQADANLADLAVSPDGRWLAYDSDVSGRQEVYVRSFPSGSGSWQVSTHGGKYPRWSTRAGEMFYVEDGAGGGKLQSVRFSAAASAFLAQPPVPLFDLPADVVLQGMHPDGNRFIARRHLPRQFKGDRIEAIVHWLDQVKAKVPAGE